MGKIMKRYALLAAAVLALAPGAEGGGKEDSGGGGRTGTRGTRGSAGGTVWNEADRGSAGGTVRNEAAGNEAARMNGFLETEISAQGAIGRLDALTGPLWTGEGGKGMRLAVLAPEAQGDVPAYLPLYIQGLLNSNLHRHSAITLIDRQNLEKIIAEQDLAAGGRYSEVDYVSIGNLTNAGYFLIGSIQKLSGDSYALHLAVTGASSGEQRAAFTGNGSLSQLEGSGSLINRASAELLVQLGIALTNAGRASLMGGNSIMAWAENALAKGAAAQAAGNQVEALLNYAQAASVDPGQLEALARLDTLSSTIGGGSVSERILNDIQARDRWIGVFKETARFYHEHPPFEIIFDPSLEQDGETDYARRRVNLLMRIALGPSEAGFAALNALLRGLERTGRRDAWGFEQWPLGDLKPPVKDTKLFSRNNSLVFNVEVLLLNDKQKEVAKGSIFLSDSPFYAVEHKSIVPLPKRVSVIRFEDLEADDLTPVLTIVINSINGIPSRVLNSRGYMRIAGGAFTPSERAYSRGWNYYHNTHDFDRAIQEYTEAIRLDPNNPLYYESRGWAYYGNDYGRAFADFTQMIRLVPDNPLYYGFRGEAYINIKDYDRAIADFTQGIRLEADNPFYYHQRGVAYYNKGDYDRAIADYSQAIRLDPDFDGYYHSRGLVYANKGDYDRAIAEYSQAISLEPNNSGYYYRRGLAYANKGDYDRAIADFTQAIRLDPNNGAAYGQRGLVYRVKRDYDRAIADFTEMIKLEPNFAFVYQSRGDVYYIKRDYDRAIADFTEAVRLDPDNGEYQASLEQAKGRGR